MNAPVNIVYPVDGGTYPISNPGPGALDSAYLTFSFSITCPGGPANVKWGVDSDTLGEAKCYDQLSCQFVWKLPGGKHRFWVDAGSCGKEQVSFKVGN